MYFITYLVYKKQNHTDTYYYINIYLCICPPLIQRNRKMQIFRNSNTKTPSIIFFAEHDSKYIL